MRSLAYGGLSSVGRASDCGSECRGFEPHIPPTDILLGCLFLFCSLYQMVLITSKPGRICKQASHTSVLTANILTD